MASYFLLKSRFFHGPVITHFSYRNIIWQKTVDIPVTFSMIDNDRHRFGFSVAFL